MATAVRPTPSTTGIELPSSATPDEIRLAQDRFIAFWSDIDQLVIPQSHARITHPDLDARNVLVRGAGHLSLPVDGRVIREIGLALAHLD